jgi:putative salt-induced outer membrane protein YdiY
MSRLVLVLCAALLFAAPTGAETLELTNGDKISGEVVETTDESVILESPLFGRVEIPRSEIVVAEVEVDPGAFGTGLFRDWTRRIAVGAAGASGNTDSAAVNAGLELFTEDEKRRWRFAASYNWGSGDGAVDTNQAFVALERDWKFEDSDFYVFGRTNYTFDSFRSFNHRVAGSLGIGYWWIDWERWRFGTRLGAGVSYQWQQESMVRPEAVGGINSIWPIAEKHRLEFHGDIFPDLAELGEFRTLSTLGWNFALTDVFGVSFGVIHEYVSDTALEANDITYQASLTYDF